MDILECYRKENLPFVCIAAPMVRYSKLPFRLLVREYGTDLTHTPMIMADSFVKSSKARDTEFTTCIADRPLHVQLASKDPCEITLATELLSPWCDGIDLNCGCPQSWARKSGLGVSLLRKPELVAQLIKSARSVTPRWRTGQHRPDHWDPDQLTDELRRRNESPFAVTAKIRIVANGSRATGAESREQQVNQTVELVRRLAAVGVDWITIHARTPDQRSGTPASWEVVHAVREVKVRHQMTGERLPIILNGDVNCMEEAHRAYQQTGCEGVMAARGLLSNPSLFAIDNGGTKNPEDLRRLMDRWLYLACRYAGGNCFRNIHQQAYWIMEPHLDRNRRLLMHSVSSFAGLVDYLDDHWLTLKLPPETRSAPQL